MEVIGITGTLGAGKSTIVNHLIKHGFKDYSVRDFIITEIKKRDLEINRDNMVIVANDLRKTKSPSYIVESLYNKAKGDKIIIESIRTPGEIEALKQKGKFTLIAVDAEQHLRFERITKRGSETDKISFDKFKEDEKKEFNNKDPSKQNLKKCIEMSDYKFDNNNSLDSLKKKVEKWINLNFG